MSGFPTLSAALIDDGIILFWAAWISVVVIANTIDALRVAGMLPADTRLASGNYTAVVHESDALNVPHVIDFIIFLTIILWEAIAAILLWRAVVYQITGSHLRTGAEDTGLSALLILFAGFILADEVFHAFKTETDHRSIAALLLISLMTIHILPR